MFSRENLRKHYALEVSEKPWLRVNFISSADGAVTLNGHSGQLGNPNDQLLMKVLRSMADVVLVGAGTVRAEGYGGLGLKEEDLTYRKELGFVSPPQIAIVTNNLGLDPGLSVFHKAETKPLVITHAGAPGAKLDALRKVADILIAGETVVDEGQAISALQESGKGQILSEGGPHLFGSLLDRGLVDEVCLTLSPNFVAGEAGRIAISKTENKNPFSLANVLQDEEGMLFLRYKKEHP